MVTYHPKDGHPQPKDGHPPEGSVVQTWNLALKFNSQNESQVSTSMDGHLPSLGGPPANPDMVPMGPVWAHLALFGPVWPRFAPFRLVWPNFAPFRPVWPRLAPFGFFRLRLASFGSVWLQLASFGSVWLHLALFGPVWPVLPHLTMVDLVWRCLTPSCPICPCLATPFNSV